MNPRRSDGGPKTGVSVVPGRWLTFVQLDPFTPAWKGEGLGDEALRDLELAILADPDGAPVVPGTGGLRKLRFAPRSWRTGKRGGLRVCYVHFKEFGIVTLVIAYGKNEKDDLNPAERREIGRLIRDIESYLQERRRAIREARR